MNRSKKYIFISVVLFIVVGFLFLNRSVCLSDQKFGVVCYQNHFLNPDNRSAEKFYRELLSAIADEEANLQDYVFYSDQLKAGISGNLDLKIRQEFNWVTEESLFATVIVDKKVAFLIQKSELERFVLYGDMTKEKIIFDYSIPPQFLPIDKLWVNGKSLLVTNKNFAFAYDGFGSCDIRKENIVLFASDAESDKACFYRQYKFDLETKTVELDMEPSNFVHGEDVDIKNFLKYLML